MNDYRAVAYLLDAYNPGKAGGTGETFDWEIARTIGVKARVILAGGLTPTNVRQAIELVRPYGVDVSTGVEISPGKKDAGLVRAFIRAAKGVDK
jgi:phosphoribosylanthranilate isomerase